MTDTYLEKYQPKTSIFEHFEVASDLAPTDKAFKTWEKLLAAKRGHDGLFLVIGKLLKDIRDQQLYKHLDYPDFKQFLASEELSFSREKAYMCIKVYEYYIDVLQLDPESVNKMNVSRLSMMVPILKKIEDPKEVMRQIEDMSSLRHGDFVRQVKEKSNRDGKPTIYYSEEYAKWVVSYYGSNTHLNDLGEFVAV